MTEYVVGFAFGLGRESVLLIRKKRPRWQAGKLNGIGGHVESEEAPLLAMCREFWEETGIRTQASAWTHFCTMKGDDWRVLCFRADLEDLAHEQTTDEEIVECRANDLPADVIPNLRWLIPTAAQGDDGVLAEVRYLDWKE